ncbi:MAG: hypothetical protein ACI85F_001758 [Bacteroidia bacterium]|jgi:hypothetical protein
MIEKLFKYCLICTLAVANTGQAIGFNNSSEEHIEVSMRMVGHQILLYAGDSSSLVMPIEKNGDQYKISFETEFGFSPDSIASVIDKVLAETNVSKNYVVEFITCPPELIVHSYEVGEKEDVLACRGRDMPLACYNVFITLLNPDSTGNALSEPMVSGDSESGLSSTQKAVAALGLLGLLGLFVFLWKKQQIEKNDPNLVYIGKYKFDTRNMVLLHDNKKIELTSKEADLLLLLSASANDIVEREIILKNVWGDEGDYVGRTLDVFISKLRRKLEGDSNVKIANIRGVGYKLVMDT